MHVLVMQYTVMCFWHLQLAVHFADAVESTVWTTAVKLNSVHNAEGVAVVFGSLCV